MQSSFCLRNPKNAGRFSPSSSARLIPRKWLKMRGLGPRFLFLTGGRIAKFYNGPLAIFG
jgi:hypothetical protein